MVTLLMLTFFSASNFGHNMTGGKYKYMDKLWMTC